eukprot:PLAT310.1.p1 GENE.PLAT310.1~~PLAT310.1.p1  ORF type:complete len:570 (+),score=187.66 PLAT310.1:101-1711(+)
MPRSGWMNDPNGPVYYHGYYHIFFQWNPKPVSGIKQWAHAYSKDLVHWTRLPPAIVPSEPYDIGGVWTGSITIVDDVPIAIYTGVDADGNGRQCIARPANASDPLLTKWVKDSSNPVIANSPGGDLWQFRDPTTGWQQPDGSWRLLVGATVDGYGAQLLFETTDWQQFTFLRSLWPAGSGDAWPEMWECPDFYTPAQASHVIAKFSIQNPSNTDVYFAGQLDSEGAFRADSAVHRYDYGTFYASKTFYDSSTGRRILWGWTEEEDAPSVAAARGWQGCLTLPREVRYDSSLGQLVTPPVAEVAALRQGSAVKGSVALTSGEQKLLPVSSRTFELNATFTFAEAAQPRLGVVLRRSASGHEQTVVYMSMAAVGGPVVFIQRVNSSGDAANITRGMMSHGGPLPVPATATQLNVRIFVDVSMIEVYAQHGAAVISSKVYAAASSDGIALFSDNAAAHADYQLWHMGAAYTDDSTGSTGIKKAAGNGDGGDQTCQPRSGLSTLAAAALGVGMFCVGIVVAVVYAQLSRRPVVHSHFDEL